MQSVVLNALHANILTYRCPQKPFCMRESWQNLIDLIVNPKATFTRLKSKPKWGAAFLVFCFLVVLLAWMVFPFTQQFVNPQYASSLASIELLGSTKAASMVLVAVSGIVLGVLCAVVFSIGLTVVSRVFKVNEALKFKHILAAWWHTILINPLVFFINIAFLPVFRHLEDIETVVDIRIIPGNSHVGAICRKSLSSDVFEFCRYLGYMEYLCSNCGGCYTRGSQ